MNRSTVREALRELESNGLLRRERGSKLMMVSRPGHEAIAGGVSRALALHEVSARDVWEGLTILEPPIAEAAAARSWTGKHIRDFRRGFELAGIDLARRVPGRDRHLPQ